MQSYSEHAQVVVSTLGKMLGRTSIACFPITLIFAVHMADQDEHVIYVCR